MKEKGFVTKYDYPIILVQTYQNEVMGNFQDHEFDFTWTGMGLDGLSEEKYLLRLKLLSLLDRGEFPQIGPCGGIETLVCVMRTNMTGLTK